MWKQCWLAPASRARGRAVVPEALGPRRARRGTRRSSRHFEQGTEDLGLNLRKPRKQTLPKLPVSEGGLRGNLPGEEKGESLASYRPPSTPPPRTFYLPSSPFSRTSCLELQVASRSSAV